MKKVNVFIRLFFFFFLCSVTFVQSMELENLSKKNQIKRYGSTSQSNSLKGKMPLGADHILNRYIKFESMRVDGMRIYVQRMLPEEIWQKIWDYLDQKSKLKLGSLACEFKYILQYAQLDVCHAKLLKACAPRLVKDNEGYYSYYNLYKEEHSFLHHFYVSTKKIGDISKDTKIDVIKMRCKEVLKDSTGEAAMLIAETESLIRRIKKLKGRRYYTSTEEYKKIKYLKEIFYEPDTCNVWCTECKDECCDTGKDCFSNVAPCFYCICCPCIICDICIFGCGSWEWEPDDELSCYDRRIKKLKRFFSDCWQ